MPEFDEARVDAPTSEFMARMAEKGDHEFFVFLSHRQADAELATRCKQLLEDLAPGDLTVWCAKVDIPVMPWPMVQPMAMTPPVPIRAPPTMWRSMSPASVKLSI